MSGFSSTRVREAIASGDRVRVQEMLSAAAASFLLAPTAAQHAAFAEDFAQLGVPAPGSAASTLTKRQKRS